MAPKEIYEDLRELARSGVHIKRENPVNDMVGAGLVGWVEIARFRRRFEWAHDHPCGIGAQIERLPVQEGSLRQVGPRLVIPGETQAPTARSASGFGISVLTRASRRISARLRR